MQNLDSLTLKFFFEENADFLKNGVIQKIQMPSRREVIFYIRNKGENRKLYININPKFPHLAFIKDKSDYFIKIPKTPPMFCMQLRKYIEGAKITNALIVPYERIIELHFSISDEFGIFTDLIVAIELMGKYSNIILYNQKTGLITGSAHNVSSDKSSIREIYGGIKYIYPPKRDKKDILKTSYAAFLEYKDNIHENFFYFTKPFADFLKERAKSDEELFKTLQNAVFKPELIKKFWGSNEEFNTIIYNYYSKIVSIEILKNKKDALLKPAKLKIKKYEKIAEEKISAEKAEKYKKTADLILQYIYLIKEGDKKVVLEGIEIDLDPDLKPAENAQKYYKLYSKSKSAYEILNTRKENAIKEKKYLEEILFTIQNSKTPDELDEIEEEINEYVLSKKDITKKEKPKLEKIEYGGFKIYIGKNNKQNDFLIRKISSANDIWLHAFNCPSSHVLIKTDKKEIPKNILLFAANLVKENSPLKSAKKASIIYTKRKFLKHPPDTPLGYVTYREEKEITV